MGMPAAVQTALITGASSGIGEALAHCFARGGYRVLLVARRLDRLQALAATLRREYRAKALALAADLAAPGAAAELAAACKRRRIVVDVLVNNAGVLSHGRFTEMPPAQHAAMLAVNVGATTAMLAQFLPPMVGRGQGRVLNVASVAAFQSVPTLATYAASKAYLLSLTESLAEELAGSGVTVTALCPGITETSMLAHAAQAHPALAKLPGFVVGEVAEVAEQGYRACLAGDVIAVPGALNRALTLAGGATPRWLLRRVAGALARRTV